MRKKILCLQDQPVKMRDGATIYADIYMPKEAMENPVPLIISWSFFGKQPWHQPVQIFRPMGVQQGLFLRFVNLNHLIRCSGVIKDMRLRT